MDHFLFAHNPLKPAGPTGLQGYIIDTVKGTWIAVEFGWEISYEELEPLELVEKRHFIHRLQIVKSSGNANEDIKSITRAARWYDSWLIQQGVEVDVKVLFAPPTDHRRPTTDD